jgi:hypothetical protein
MTNPTTTDTSRAHPGPLGLDDPEVAQAMATIDTMPAQQQREILRTVYRYVYAYRRTHHPNTLIELVNSLITTPALWANPHYRRAVAKLDTDPSHQAQPDTSAPAGHDATRTPADGQPATVDGRPRVLVTGSRTWADTGTIRRQLARCREQYPGAVLVHGDAPGADRIAAAIWQSWGLPTEPHPADWATHGRAAGPRRNTAMVTAGAAECLAFIRNHSRGATHCAHQAEAAGIPTIRTHAA